MASNDVKDISGILGDCGRFQVIFTTCVHATTLASVFGMMIMVFGMYNPGWKCMDQNFTESYLKSTPSSNKEYLNSTQWSVDCDIKRECHNLVYNDESSTVVTEWDLSCDLAWVPSFMISIQMTGALIGSYFAGQIADRFGRKVSLYLHVALHGICNFAAIFSTSWQMYTAILFFLGYGAYGTICNSFSFPFEFANIWGRGIIVSMPFWNVCFLLFTLTAFALRDWTLVHIVTTALSVLVFIPVIWTPESVRWLAVRGKVNKSKKVVAKVSRVNNRPCPDTDIIDEIAREEKTQMGDHVYTVLDIFIDPILRSYSLKFGFIWLTMAYTYYGLSFGVRSFAGDFYINILISSLTEMPGLIVVLLLVNRAGRRSTALVFFICEVVLCIALVTRSLMTSGRSDDMFVLIIASLCRMIITAVWNVFGAYSSELYPTVVRSIHYGYLSALSRLGGIVSPYLIPDDPDNMYIAFVIIGVIGVISCIVIWTLPETKERVMPDTSASTSQKVKAPVNGDAIL